MSMVWFSLKSFLQKIQVYYTLYWIKHYIFADFGTICVYVRNLGGSWSCIVIFGSTDFWRPCFFFKNGNFLKGFHDGCLQEFVILSNSSIFDDILCWYPKFQKLNKQPLFLVLSNLTVLYNHCCFYHFSSGLIRDFW